MTDLGQVVSGDSEVIAGTTGGAVVTTSGTAYGSSILQYSSITGGDTDISGVSSSGEVVGTNISSNGEGFTYSNGQLTYLDSAFDLPELLPGYGNATQLVISPDGTVGGVYNLPSDPTGIHTFRIVNGAFNDLGVVGSGGTEVLEGINDAGTIVGQVNGVAFTYDSALHLFPTGYITNDINASGQIAGELGTPSHAFSGDNSGITDLTPSESGSSSVANGISNDGIVAGTDDGESGGNTGVIWSNGGEATLDSLIDTPEQWKVTDAYKFDAQGRLACIGLQLTGTDSLSTHVLLLTPSSNGGGLTTPALTPVEAKSTLSTSIVDGATLKGLAGLSVTNSTGGADTGTVTLFATTTGGVDSSSVAISATKKLSLKSGKSSKISLAAKKGVILPAGTYTILAQTTDAAGVVTTAASGPSLVVAPATVTLAGTLTAPAPTTAKPGKPVSFALTLTNAGNVDSTGTATIAINLTSTAGVVTALTPTVSKPLKIKASSKPLKLTLHFKLPATLAADVYSVTANVAQGVNTLSLIAAAGLTVVSG